MAGVPDSKITLLAAWESKTEHSYHTAYKQNLLRNHLQSWKKIPEPLPKHTKWKIAFISHRYFQHLLPEGTQGQCLKLLGSRTNHIVSYPSFTCCKGRGYQFLWQYLLNWHLPTRHINVLCLVHHLASDVTGKWHTPFRYVLTSKVNSVVINLPQPAINRLCSSQKQKRDREIGLARRERWSCLKQHQKTPTW